MLWPRKRHTDPFFTTFPQPLLQFALNRAFRDSYDKRPHSSSVGAFFLAPPLHRTQQQGGAPERQPATHKSGEPLINIIKVSLGRIILIRYPRTHNQRGYPLFGTEFGGKTRTVRGHWTPTTTTATLGYYVRFVIIKTTYPIRSFQTIQALPLLFRCHRDDGMNSTIPHSTHNQRRRVHTVHRAQYNATGDIHPTTILWRRSGPSGHFNDDYYHRHPPAHKRLTWSAPIHYLVWSPFGPIP